MKEVQQQQPAARSFTELRVERQRHAWVIEEDAPRELGVLTENHHPRAKLWLHDVEQIRASNERQIELARRYGVCQTNVSRILRGVTWRPPATPDLVALRRAIRQNRSKRRKRGVL